jgi:hypothetical protein
MSANEKILKRLAVWDVLLRTLHGRIGRQQQQQRNGIISSSDCGDSGDDNITTAVDV